MYKAKQLALSSIPLLLLSACVDVSIDTGVSIASPTANSFLLKSDVESEMVTINYQQKSDILEVYINGQVVPAQDISRTEKQAEIPLSKLSEHLKQGENIIAVNPLRFGPRTKFIVDTAGPKVVIKEVQCSTVTCADNSDIITVKGELKDPSAIQSLSLEALQYNAAGGVDEQGYPAGALGVSIDNQAAQIEGNNFVVHINKGQAYKFHASDVNGYEQEAIYLAGDQEINPIFKARVGNSALNLLAPAISDNASNMSAQALDPNKPNYSSGLANLKIMQSGDGTAYATPSDELGAINCQLNSRTWNPAGVYNDIVKEMEKNCTYTGKDGETMYMYVGEMVTDREDGDTYIGVYEALESELLSLKARDDTKARIRQRLSQISMSLAA